MICLDTSVALALLLDETRAPPASLRQETLVASRLLEYEIWTRIHALGLGRSHGEEVRALLDRVGLIELIPSVLARAVDPFPVPVRTLDALHLASMAHLRGRSQTVELASYDEDCWPPPPRWAFRGWHCEPPHSIVSSARRRTARGMVRPNARAVRWLMSGSKRVRSLTGLAPLRLSTDAQPDAQTTQ